MTDIVEEPRAPDARFAECLIPTVIPSQDFSNEPDEELKRILEESIRTADVENKQRQKELKYLNNIRKLMEEDRLRQEQIHQEHLKIKQKLMEERTIKFHPILKRLTNLSRFDEEIKPLINLINDLIQHNKYINIDYYDDFQKSLPKTEFDIIEFFFCEDIVDEYDYYSDE